MPEQRWSGPGHSGGGRRARMHGTASAPTAEPTKRPPAQSKAHSDVAPSHAPVATMLVAIGRAAAHGLRDDGAYDIAATERRLPDAPLAPPTQRLRPCGRHSSA